jgi:hypothetical protein
VFWARWLTGGGKQPRVPSFRKNELAGMGTSCEPSSDADGCHVLGLIGEMLLEAGPGVESPCQAAPSTLSPFQPLDSLE